MDVGSGAGPDQIHVTNHTTMEPLMTDWVDFKELKARVSIEDVLLRYYELRNLVRDGGSLVGPCPVHGGDSPRAFHADLERSLWHCFSGCKSGGNQLDLVAKKEGVSVRDAALRLLAAFPPMARNGTPAQGPTPTATSPPSPRTAAAPANLPVAPAQPAGNRPLSLTLQLLADHPHLVTDRGLTSDTISMFGVGYCPRGILAGMIATPVHDEHGQHVAYAGRRLKPQDVREHGKYKFPKGFKKELVLFNLHRVKTRDMVIVVEGFFSTMLLHQLGFANVVALMGSSLSTAQADLLATFTEVFLLLDGDEAGRAGAASAAELLGSRTVVRLIELPEGFEPENASARMLRWAFTGTTILDLSRVSFAARVGVSTPTI